MLFQSFVLEFYIYCSWDFLQLNYFHLFAFNFYSQLLYIFKCVIPEVK